MADPQIKERRLDTACAHTTRTLQPFSFYLALKKDPSEHFSRYSTAPKADVFDRSMVASSYGSRLA
jgi:hypothetical protein